MVLGCSHVSETAKVLWGSSTKALEKTRDQATVKTFQCDRDKCMDAIVELARIKPQVPVSQEGQPTPATNIVVPGASESNTTASNAPVSSSAKPGTPETNTSEPKTAAPTTTGLNIFLQDRSKGLIVLMNVPDAIDTTEVGLFFVPVAAGTTRVEVSSLSEVAKLSASELVFKELEKLFPAVENK